MKATKIISECELFRLFSLCGEAFSSDEISTRLETAIEHFVERISRPVSYTHLTLPTTPYV